MSELLNLVLQAHGGVDRWRTFKQVTASFVSGGGLMPMKGISVPPTPLEGTATIHHESTVISPFGKPDQRMVFTPERVVVETTSGSIVEERLNPRAAFAGHTLTTPWTCFTGRTLTVMPVGHISTRTSSSNIR